MGRRLWIAVASAAISCAGGCGARVPANVQLTEGFAAAGTPYGDALHSNTRYAELYLGFDTVVKGWVTERTPELRTALAEASIRAYHLEGAAAEALRKETMTPPPGGREFHLALYMPKKQWNDLEASDSLWRARLELRDGSTVGPTGIKALAKTDKSPVEYPYVSPWTREYTIVFPAMDAAAAGPPNLVLAGPLGTLRFVF